MSAEDIKRKFYKLACSYGISVGTDMTTVTLSGLNDNLPQALELMEDILANAKADSEAYNKYVESELKNRKDAKLNQAGNFSALLYYGIYGPYNRIRNIPGAQELRDKNPKELTGLLKDLSKYEHTVLYYGPYSVDELASVIEKKHRTAGKLAQVPAGKEYTEQQTTENEIMIAPYEAKNAYISQYCNNGRKWSAEKQPVVEIFNEYFGGGMNSVVFQELRESRGLAYSAWATYNTPGRKNHNEFARTQIISQNDKMMDCIRTFNNIIDTIPQSEKAFGLAKQAITKRLAAQRTTKFSILNAYLAAQRMGIDYDINEKIYNALPGITMKDMVDFEKETMAGKPYRYLILGDEKNLDIKSLERIAPVKRLTTEEIFGY